MMGGMGSMMSGSMIDGGLFGMLFALLFWAVLVALLVLVARIALGITSLLARLGVDGVGASRP